MKTETRSLIICLIALALQLNGTKLHAELRTFTSITGTTIRGELDTINGDMVTIKKEDGKFITTKAANFSAADQAFLKEHGLKDAAAPAAFASATKERPFVNSLGMKFVPVPGTDVLFAITLTRCVDYNLFAATTTDVNSDNGPGGEKRDKSLFPTSTLSWNRAKAFCDWLSKKEGLAYRLPTDREWSVAVGIGSQEAAGATPEELNGKCANVFPWGTQWPPPDGFANYADESLNAYLKKVKYQPIYTIKGYKDGEVAISPVMAFRPNKLGLYDMGGNLWQWCEDWYDAAKTKKLLRGASWDDSEMARLFSSSRWPNDSDFQETKTSKTGFRCVLEVAKQ